jgi:hypothetical protein
MFLSKQVILSKDDCFALVESNEGFTKAKLYYNGDGGVHTPVFIPSQRNALSKDFNLSKDTILYDKINSAINSVGYRLKSDNIKYSVVKYFPGHFIHKHKDGAEIFMTISIQLSEADSYEGGEFIYWIDGIEYTLDKELGYGIITGPEVMHEVKVVTKGERNSFVLFLNLTDVIPLEKPSLI